jgi:two-component system sensor histidine kinase PilS (NtrC family)
MVLKSTIKYPDTTSWQALGYYNLYRFLIAFLFVSLYWIGQLPQPLGSYDSNVFAISSHLYLLASVTALFFIKIRTPPFFYQVTGHVLLDILLIGSFIYASAGLNSGFGMLMVIAIAGGGILLPGLIGFFFAAVATIVVLGHEVYFELAQNRPSPNYTHAAFLGVTYFLTAVISHALAKRVEKSEALAEQRAVDLKNLGKLNEYIVQRLQSGILVLDDQLRIRLSNESAHNLLASRDSLHYRELESIAPALTTSIHNWLAGEGSGTFIVKPASTGVDVQVSLSRLTMGDRTEILVFLDDVSRLRQQAQQLKLASLGRLTASIAHEVRNPLGAISHAGQLLSESDMLSKEDHRLTEIINEQSVRVNSIIENVMRISRRERSVPTAINLNQWLTRFLNEFRQRYQLQDGDISLSIPAQQIQANMDPDQLYQIMWNICENGIRYSRERPLLELRCSIQAESGRPFIDMIDRGDGMSAEVTDHLFEPFITTEIKGTGLGLFIARELCEANQATLALHANTSKGCCFRITFSHPDRRQVIA